MTKYTLLAGIAAGLIVSTIIAQSDTNQIRLSTARVAALRIASTGLCEHNLATSGIVSNEISPLLQLAKAQSIASHKTIVDALESLDSTQRTMQLAQARLVNDPGNITFQEETAQHRLLLVDQVVLTQQICAADFYALVQSLPADDVARITVTVRRQGFACFGTDRPLTDHEHRVLRAKVAETRARQMGTELDAAHASVLRTEQTEIQLRGEPSEAEAKSLSASLSQEILQRFR